jgi:hypothetical protein
MSSAIRIQVARASTTLCHHGDGVRDFSSKPSHPHLPALQR